MKVYFASDHAGFALKNTLVEYVHTELMVDVVDCGAFEFNPDDDYPLFVAEAAKKVAADPDGSRAIILGASGQGEAMVANRFKGVRAAVYYGDTGVQHDASGHTLDIISSVRMHNNANVLSLGSRFLTPTIAKEAVKRFLKTDFSTEERHVRRLQALDSLNTSSL